LRSDVTLTRAGLCRAADCFCSAKMIESVTEPDVFVAKITSITVWKAICVHVAQSIVRRFPLEEQEV
jgi:hypothetical protein